MHAVVIWTIHDLSGNQYNTLSMALHNALTNNDYVPVAYQNTSWCKDFTPHPNQLDVDAEQSTLINAVVNGLAPPAPRMLGNRNVLRNAIQQQNAHSFVERHLALHVFAVTDYSVF